MRPAIITGCTSPPNAKSGAFGGRIARGFPTLSLAVTFWTELLEVDDVMVKVNYGLDKVRFVSRVRVGARADERGGGGGDRGGGRLSAGRRPGDRDRRRHQARPCRPRAVPLPRLNRYAFTPRRRREGGPSRCGTWLRKRRANPGDWAGQFLARHEEVDSSESAGTRSGLARPQLFKVVLPLLRVAGEATNVRGRDRVGDSKPWTQ